ncbi:MAG: hypothetical protein EAZ06_01510 [Cytophagales bacterium]|nr:MAG: hypothetical protein EAY69_07280 [Cytophagales bacterium]TAH31014.1 MAG: hypothetical protein EAZ06_01510 [Cytophagales bacterium]
MKNNKIKHLSILIMSIGALLNMYFDVEYFSIKIIGACLSLIGIVMMLYHYYIHQQYAHIRNAFLSIAALFLVLISYFILMNK